MTNFVDRIIKDLQAVTEFLVGKAPTVKALNEKAESKSKKIKAKK